MPIISSLLQKKWLICDKKLNSRNSSYFVTHQVVACDTQMWRVTKVEKHWCREREREGENIHCVNSPKNWTWQAIVISWALWRHFLCEQNLFAKKMFWNFHFFLLAIANSFVKCRSRLIEKYVFLFRKCNCIGNY